MMMMVMVAIPAVTQSLFYHLYYTQHVYLFTIVPIVVTALVTCLIIHAEAQNFISFYHAEIEAHLGR